MDAQQSSYLVRLARVGSVLLALAVLAGFVIRAQRRGGASPEWSSPSEHQVLRLESLEVVEETDDSDDVDFVSSSESLDPSRARFPNVPERFTLDVELQMPSELRIPPLKVDRSLLPLDQPLQPDGATFAPSDPYISSSKSAVIEVVPPERSGRGSRRR